jgi:hypothetical protein
MARSLFWLSDEAWKALSRTCRAAGAGKPRERLKKGEFEEAIGRSRGGRTSKIHALADDRVALTPGAKNSFFALFPSVGLSD